MGRLLAIIRGFISAQQRDSRVARPRSGMGRLGLADNGTVTLARSFNATPSPVGSRPDVFVLSWPVYRRWPSRLTMLATWQERT